MYHVFALNSKSALNPDFLFMLSRLHSSPSHVPYSNHVFSINGILPQSNPRCFPPTSSQSSRNVSSLTKDTRPCEQVSKSSHSLPYPASLTTSKWLKLHPISINLIYRNASGSLNKGPQRSDASPAFIDSTLLNRLGPREGNGNVIGPDEVKLMKENRHICSVTYSYYVLGRMTCMSSNVHTWSYFIK